MAVSNFDWRHKVNDWFHWLQWAVQRNRDEKPTSFSSQSTEVIVAPFGASRIAWALAICSVAASPELVLAMVIDPRLQKASPMDTPIESLTPLNIVLEKAMTPKDQPYVFNNSWVLTKTLGIPRGCTSNMMGYNIIHDAIKPPQPCWRRLWTTQSCRSVCPTYKIGECLLVVPL